MLKDRLREARKNAGLTQKQVADSLGVTESTYCGYETGKRQPDPVKISRIAGLLGVSGDYLLETDFSENEKKLAIASDDELDREVLSLIQSLPESKKVEALNYLRYLSASLDMQ